MFKPPRRGGTKQKQRFRDVLAPNGAMEPCSRIAPGRALCRQLVLSMDHPAASIQRPCGYRSTVLASAWLHQPPYDNEVTMLTVPAAVSTVSPDISLMR